MVLQLTESVCVFHTQTGQHAIIIVFFCQSFSLIPVRCILQMKMFRICRTAVHVL